MWYISLQSFHVMVVMFSSSTPAYPMAFYAATKKIACRRYRLRDLEYLFIEQKNVGSLEGATSGSYAPFISHFFAV